MEENKISELLVCDLCKSTHLNHSGNGIYVCENCGSKKIIVSEANKNNIEIISMLKNASMKRKDHKFKEAYSIYEEILKMNPSESAALEGLVLSRYGIEYVEDTTLNKYLPTCHYLHFGKISQTDLYKKCINKVDDDARELINEKTQAIEKLMEDIQKVYNDEEEDYDVFVSCKITDPETKEKTEDYKIAYDIYRELSKKYKVFFSAESITVAGRDYEPYICNAIQKAKVFILVGTKKEYVDSPWVKNEYNRFITKLSDNNISSEHFINVCDMDILKDMPVIGSAPQGINCKTPHYLTDIDLSLDKMFSNEETYQEKLKRKNAKRKVIRITILSSLLVVILGLLLAFYFTRPVVTFVDFDSSIIGKEKKWFPWTKVDAPINPKRDSTDKFKYEFIGWDTDYNDANESITVKAQYKEIERLYVIFYDGDMNIISVQELTDGTTEVIPPVEPTKESDEKYHYVFKGWSTSYNNITKSTNIYALFDKIERIYVTFYDWDKKVIEKIELEKPGSVTPPDNPLRESDDYYKYSFVRWSVDLSNITESIDVYAEYEKTPILYKVSFEWDKNCGEVMNDNLSLSFKDTVRIKANPFDGYEFIGWFINGSLISNDLEYVYEVTKNDVAITARFEFKGLEGYESISTPEELLNIKKDGKYILERDIDLNDTIWHPFAFTGELNGNNHKIKNLKIGYGNSNCGMFSELKGIIINLEIENMTLNTNGSNNENVGGLVGLLHSGAKLENIKVSGVINAKNSINVGGIIGKLVSSQITKTSNLESNVEVSGKANVGGIFGYLEEELDGTISLDNFTNNGKVIGSQESAGGLIGHIKIYTPINGMGLKDNTSLSIYGIKEEIREYVVNHYTNILGTSEYKLYRTNEYKVINETKADVETYEIKGFIKPTKTLYTLFDDKTKNVINLYYERSKYNVKFMVDDKVDSECELYYEQRIEYPNVSKEGYLLVSWNDANGNSYEVVDDKSIVLYSKWNPISYKVIFNDGNGSTKEQRIAYDTKNNLSSNTFTKIGYTFLGWSKTLGSSNIDYHNNQEITNLCKTNNESFNLYAVWKANTYKIIYHQNDGSSTTKVQVMTYDKKESLSENTFTKYCYEFIGWSLNPANETISYKDRQSVLNLLTKDNDEINVYAVWKAIKYNIEYIIDNYSEKFKGTEKYIYGETITLKTVEHNIYPTYISFLGWYTDKDKTIPANDDFISSLEINPSNVTLYGKWEEVQIFTSIITTPDLNSQKKVIVDWSQEINTDVVSQKRSSDKKICKRDENIDISGITEEVIFIGDVAKQFTNLSIHIVNYPKNSKVKITLDNFKFVSNVDGAIKVWTNKTNGIDNGIIFTLETIGDSKISTSWPGGAGLRNFTNQVNFTGKGTLTIVGGKGYYNGNGGIGVDVNDVIVNIDGTLNIIGGEGGIGTTGSNGAKGSNGVGYDRNKSAMYMKYLGKNGENGNDGGEGGIGKEGGLALSAKVINVLQGKVYLTGGKGGTGGTGGAGGAGGRGGDSGSVSDTKNKIGLQGGKGGTGGAGGAGGIGGNGGISSNSDLIMIGIKENIFFKQGAKGVGGTGGVGGIGGAGGAGGNGKVNGIEKNGDNGGAGMIGQNGNNGNNDGSGGTGGAGGTGGVGGEGAYWNETNVGSTSSGVGGGGSFGR